MRALVVGTLIVAAAHDATANPSGNFEPTPYVEPDTFVGVDSLGSLGLGLAIDHEDAEPAASYDYTLRLGKVWRASDRWRPGGFLELHSFDLAMFDAAIGPQLQYRINTDGGGQLAIQLRGGAGVGSEGTHALAGLHFGTPYIGASVTARRSFDTKDIVVSLNLEVLALVPVALAVALQ